MTARRISPARTVTESDIALFAGLSADFSPVHSDAAYAARGVFGRRVAHGLLGMSLAEGLLSRTPGQEAPAAAWGWSFDAPIFAGDTIHAVAEPEPASRRGDGPACERVTVYRHDGHAVQRGRVLYDGAGTAEPFADVVVRQGPAPPPASTTAPEHADETGVFFEDLEVGDRFTTPGYTLGAFELAAFAGLTGDTSAGLFGLTLVEGLKHCLAPDRGVGTPMASLSWRWRRGRPLRVGDTVFLEVAIQGKRASRSRSDRGIVAQSIHLVAAGRGIVQQGQHVQMFRRRPLARIFRRFSSRGRQDACRNGSHGPRDAEGVADTSAARCRSGLREYGPLRQADWRPQQKSGETCTQGAPDS